MKKSFFGLIIALLFSNCSDTMTSEQLLDDYAVKTPVAFSVSQEPISRSVSYLNNADDLYQFYVVAQIQNQVYAHQFFIRDNFNNYSALGEEVFWPNDSRETVSFFAVNFSGDYNYLREAVERDTEIIPLTSASFEVPVDGFLYQDLVAAYSVTSANQTTNGIAPLTFNHMLAEVEVYAKGDYSSGNNINYSITGISFETLDQKRFYHFDSNTWTAGTQSQQPLSIPYFSSNGLWLTNTNDYVEIKEDNDQSGSNFIFMIPGAYTLRVDYLVLGRPVSKTCTVTLAQNQKNIINLILTPPAPEPSGN